MEKATTGTNLERRGITGTPHPPHRSPDTAGQEDQSSIGPKNVKFRQKVRSVEQGQSGRSVKRTAAVQHTKASGHGRRKKKIKSPQHMQQ